MQQVMESGYVSELIADGTDEAEERRRNLQELVNAALQYQEENEEGDLEGFLASAALASDAGSKDTAADRVTLMTLRSRSWNFLWSAWWVGAGLFPSYRSLDDPASLEEERRLCYVGITRAKSVCSFPMPASGVFEGHARAAVPSLFLSELPESLVRGDIPQSGGAALRRDRRLERLTRVDRDKPSSAPMNAVRRRQAGPAPVGAGRLVIR